MDKDRTGLLFDTETMLPIHTHAVLENGELVRMNMGPCDCGLSIHDMRVTIPENLINRGDEANDNRKH